jgi:Spy/CpxP family protein refolding chaperone
MTGPELLKRFARAQEMITSRLNSQLDELKATPDQRAQILAIKDRVLQQAKAQFEQGAQQRQGDRQWAIDQLTSNNPDKAALYAKADAKADQFKAFSHQLIDALVEVNAVLTPDQRAQLKSKIEQLHARGEGGWGPPGMDY